MAKEAAAIVTLQSELPEEPTTPRQAQPSPEWTQWRGALQREMEGQLSRGVWGTVDRPKGKTVLGTRLVFEKKINKDGQIEKCKCRFVARGFRQISGINYQESSSPTPAQSSIRMALALMATQNWEGRQPNVKMTYLEADVEGEIYIELPDEYRQSKKQVGRLNKAMYGLVHAGLLWSNKFGQQVLRQGFREIASRPLRPPQEARRLRDSHHSRLCG
ncbi:unnamed protein product [Sphacelaria rigidula]